MNHISRAGVRYLTHSISKGAGGRPVISSQHLKGVAWLLASRYLFSKDELELNFLAASMFLFQIRNGGGS